MTFRYIAVEGPPGVGKTELSKGLAAKLDGAALHEEKNNPFLRDFLAGKGGAAFQAQIFFLLNRYRQLSGGPLGPAGTSLSRSIDPVSVPSSFR